MRRDVGDGVALAEQLSSGVVTPWAKYFGHLVHCEVLPLAPLPEWAHQQCVSRWVHTCLLDDVTVVRQCTRGAAQVWWR